MSPSMFMPRQVVALERHAAVFQIGDSRSMSWTDQNAQLAVDGPRHH